MADSIPGARLTRLLRMGSVSPVEDEEEQEREAKADAELYRLDCDRFRGLRNEMDDTTNSESWLYLFFKHFIRLAILGNSAFMAVAASTREPTILMLGFDHIFTGIFAVEMIVEFIRFGWREYFMGSWRRMDFVLAWLAILDNWILPAVQGQDGHGLCFLFPIRLLRVMRLFRIMRAKSELSSIVEGVFGAISAMCWVLVLLVVIIFCAGLLCMTLVEPSMYQGTEFEYVFDAENRFGTLLKSMLTMLNVLILDAWGDIIWPVFYVQPHLTVFFIAYIMFTTFGVMNVVVGVVTERALCMSQHHAEIEQEEQRRHRMKKIMRLADELFEDCDPETGRKSLTRDDLETTVATNECLLAELRGIDFPRGFTLRDLHLMFDEEYTATLSKDEFINGMFRVVFNNEFQQNCCILLEIANVRKGMEDHFAKLHENFERARERGERDRASEKRSELKREDAADGRRDTDGSKLSSRSVDSKSGLPSALRVETPALQQHEKHHVEETVHLPPQPPLLEQPPPEGKFVEPEDKLADSKASVVDAATVLAALESMQRRLRQAEAHLLEAQAAGKTELLGHLYVMEQRLLAQAAMVPPAKPETVELQLQTLPPPKMPKMPDDNTEIDIQLTSHHMHQANRGSACSSRGSASSEKKWSGRRVTLG